MLLKERCRSIFKILHILQFVEVQKIEFDLLWNNLVLTIAIIMILGLLKPLFLGLERSDRHWGIFDKHWWLII